ncbi:MAG: type II toxin-antitoxin system death-on-curing family toxin [Candidatus Magasanikbacteria bacterium]|nr:type II toxin-antitoxin system death-on-curing family toxin [Candidatus Magasanikbacteria bacterium]
MNIYYLDTELMEKMCHPLAVALLNGEMQEPIPSFKPYNEQMLESALAQPKQTFDSQDLYKTLVQKASILYFSLVKNHCFQNGNKRIATASLLVFLWINDFWLKADSKELADWAIKIAISDGSDNEIRTELLKNLQIWIKNNLIDRPELEIS